MNFSPLMCKFEGGYSPEASLTGHLVNGVIIGEKSVCKRTILMVLKAPSYRFSSVAGIEGSFITIMFHITYSNKIGLSNLIGLSLKQNSTIIAAK